MQLSDGPSQKNTIVQNKIHKTWIKYLFIKEWNKRTKGVMKFAISPFFLLENKMQCACFHLDFIHEDTFIQYYFQTIFDRMNLQSNFYFNPKSKWMPFQHKISGFYINSSSYNAPINFLFNCQGILCIAVLNSSIHLIGQSSYICIHTNDVTSFIVHYFWLFHFDFCFYLKITSEYPSESDRIWMNYGLPNKCHTFQLEWLTFQFKDSIL